MRVQGTVTVRIADLGNGESGAAIGTGSARPEAPMTGTLVDASAGGLALDLPISGGRLISPGTHLRCSFLVGEGDSFQDLAAIVVATAPGPRPGVQHVRLSFTSLPGAEEDRLVAAVARRERRPSSHAGGS